MTESPVFSYRLIEAGSLILDFQDKLDARSKETLDSYSKIIEENSAKHIVLNFSELDHMDGSGLKLLTIFLSRVMNKGCTISAYGANEDLFQIFKLTHLDEWIDAFPNEDAALARGEKRSVA